MLPAYWCLSIPSNGFEAEGGDREALDSPGFQFHRIDSPVLVPSVSQCRMIFFQFHRMDSELLRRLRGDGVIFFQFHRMDSLTPWKLSQAGPSAPFNSIEWIPCELQVVSGGVRFLSIPSNGFE